VDELGVSLELDKVVDGLAVIDEVSAMSRWVREGF